MSKGSHMAYNDGLNHITKQIKELNAALTDHAKQAYSEDFPWTYSGDLEHLSKLLSEAINFIKGED